MLANGGSVEILDFQRAQNLRLRNFKQRLNFLNRIALIDPTSSITSRRVRTMEIDTEKVDEAVLALLYLTLHDRPRAWKSFDWATLNRLHAKGLIADPVSKAKSVALTDEGLRASERLFGQR
jgi:hypothetical protein